MKSTKVESGISQHQHPLQVSPPYQEMDMANPFFLGKTQVREPFFQRKFQPVLQTKLNANNDHEIIQKQQDDGPEPIELSKKEQNAVNKYGEKYEELKIELAGELTEFEDELSIQNYLRPIMKTRYNKENWWMVKPPKNRRFSNSTDWTSVEYADDLFFQQYDIEHTPEVHIEIVNVLIDDYFTPSKPGMQHDDLFIGTEHESGSITISVVNPSVGKDELEIYMCDEKGVVLREVLPESGTDFNIHKKGESFQFQVNKGEATIRIISYRSHENTAEGTAEPHDFTFYKIAFEKKIIRKKSVRFAPVFTVPKPGKAQRLRHGKFIK